MSPLLAARGLRAGVGRCVSCHDLNLDIRPGERWAILGQNGTGKTTLLHTLAGLTPPQEGTILLSGTPIHHQPRIQVARRLGILFQEPPTPHAATVLETALLGRHPHLSPFQMPRQKDHDLALAALQAMDLEGLASRPLATLSGGEKRRLEMAVLLAQDPPLLLLDEPTGHLDLPHAMALLTLLGQRAARPGHAFAAILHDINLAAHFCNRFLLLMGDGQTRQGGREESLTRESLTALYGYPLAPIPTPMGTLWFPEVDPS